MRRIGIIPMKTPKVALSSSLDPLKADNLNPAHLVTNR